MRLVESPQEEAAAPGPGRRQLFGGRLTAFVDSYALRWEISLGVLSAAYVVASLVEDASPPAVNAATVSTFAIGTVLFAEFVLRLADSRDRLQYLRGHWLDAITCIPLIGPLRGLRLLRLLRFIRLGVSIRRLAQGHDGGESISWAAGPLVLLFWGVAAYAVWIFEHGRNPAVSDFGQALYLAFMTAATLGFSGVQLVTPEGKAVGGVTIFVAIGLMGLLSSRLTAYWLGENSNEASLRRELAHLTREVREIRSAMETLVEVVSPSGAADQAGARTGRD